MKEFQKYYLVLVKHLKDFAFLLLLKRNDFQLFFTLIKKYLINKNIFIFNFLKKKSYKIIFINLIIMYRD